MQGRQLKNSVAAKQSSHEKKLPTGSWLKMAEIEEEQSENRRSIKCLKITQKAVYILVLFILVLILILQIAKCFQTYMKGPTYIETKIAPQHRALFPAMTICPVTAGYREDVLQVRVK